MPVPGSLPRLAPLVGLLLLLVLSNASQARTLIVNPDGTGEFPTIEAAVAAALRLQRETPLRSAMACSPALGIMT